MKYLWLALLLSSMLAPQVGGAVALIDDFSDDMPTVYSPASGSTALPSGLFSDSRDWSLTHTGTLATFLIFDGILALNSNANSQGILTLSYNNGSGFDFTPFGNAFFIEVTDVEPNGVVLTLTVDGSQHSRTIDQPGQVTFLFDDFTGADLTDVHQVQLEIYSNYQVDSGYRAFGIKVPEPFPLALLTLASLAALTRRGRG